MKPTKYYRYLGDGVYVDYDGYNIILTTEKSMSSTTSRIYLEPKILDELLQYNMQLRQQLLHEPDRTETDQETS